MRQCAKVQVTARPPVKTCRVRNIFIFRYETMADVPVYNNNFALYSADVFVWSRLTSEDKAKQGLLLFSRLPVNLRERFVEKENVQNLCSEDGVEILLKSLEIICAQKPVGKVSRDSQTSENLFRSPPKDGAKDTHVQTVQPGAPGHQHQHKDNQVMPRAHLPTPSSAHSDPPYDYK